MYSNFQYEILQAIEKNDYEHATVIGESFNDDFRFVNGLYDLIEKGLVAYCPDKTKEQCISNIEHYRKHDYPFSFSYHVYLTEAGHSVLDHRKDQLLKLELLENECDSLKEALNLYKDNLDSTAKEAKFAKTTSVISIVVAIMAIIVPLLYG